MLELVKWSQTLAQYTHTNDRVYKLQMLIET